MNAKLSYYREYRASAMYFAASWILSTIVMISSLYTLVHTYDMKIS